MCVVNSKHDIREQPLFIFQICLTIEILQIIHRLVLFLRKLRFGDWILSPSSGVTYSDQIHVVPAVSRDRLYLLGPNEWLPP
jgi:hypothetical protein